jgi:putative ABC transport system permease protein
MSVVVRTDGEPTALAPAMRRAIRQVDTDQPIAGVATMDDLLEASVGQQRLSMIMLEIFSGIALLLAAVGIYGVLSYSVTQRTRELGIRMALGAARGRVLALVVRQGMTLVVGGIALGLIGAFGLTRLLGSQLYAVEPTDPATSLSSRCC